MEIVTKIGKFVFSVKFSVRSLWMEQNETAEYSSYDFYFISNIFISNIMCFL